MTESLEIMNFSSEKFGSVRTIQQDGEPWFVAADVCKALEISNSRMATDRLDDDEKGVISTDTLGGNQNMTIVNEPGLYSLVLGSRKPEAKAFKRWITHEVIPVIRKTGGYVNDEDTFVNTYLSYADEQTKSLFRATLKTINTLNNKIKTDEPKVLFAEAVSESDSDRSMKELASVLAQSGIKSRAGKPIGRTGLFNDLRDKGYLIKQRGVANNYPTQKSVNLGLFSVIKKIIHPVGGNPDVKTTIRVTPKGMQYFVNLYCKEQGVIGGVGNR